MPMETACRPPPHSFPCSREAIRPILRLALLCIAAWRVATGSASQGITASHTLGCSTVVASLFQLHCGVALLDNRSYLTYMAHCCHMPDSLFFVHTYML